MRTQTFLEVKTFSLNLGKFPKHVLKYVFLTFKFYYNRDSLKHVRGRVGCTKPTADMVRYTWAITPSHISIQLLSLRSELVPSILLARIHAESLYRQTYDKLSALRTSHSSQSSMTKNIPFFLVHRGIKRTESTYVVTKCHVTFSPKMACSEELIR